MTVSNVSKIEAIKTKIPAEVADAIEQFRAAREDNESIIYRVLNDGTAYQPVASLRSIPFDTLLAALVNGYEREMTEEEAREKAYGKIRTTFEGMPEPGDAWDDGCKHGIIYALDTLGIKIEGVNA